MNLSKLHRLYLAVAVFGLCTLPAAAQAEARSGEFVLAANTDTNPGYCRSYGKRAADANKANVKNNCGFTGARWNSDPARHSSWCLNQTRATAESESRARQRLLQECKQGGTRATNQGYCRAYAKRAANANKANLKNGCGFAGARWNSDPDRHYNWCLRVPRRTAESESRARQRQLQSCR